MKFSDIPLHYVKLGMKWIERLLGYESTLSHIGNENSGRYPRGSGERSYQHTGKQLKKGGVIKDGPNLVENALKTGAVKLKVNKQLQLDHCEATHQEGRGYVKGGVEFAEQLVEDLHGTGTPVIDAKGNWTRKERVTANDKVAVNEYGEDTDALMIHYSKTGTHIMTRQEDKK